MDIEFCTGTTPETGFPGSGFEQNSVFDETWQLVLVDEQSSTDFLKKDLDDENNCAASSTPKPALSLYHTKLQFAVGSVRSLKLNSRYLSEKKSNNNR